MTNHELKGWLRAKGLGISGAKNVLIQRIKDYLRVQEQERNNVDASNDTNSSSDASFSSERFHSRKKDAFDPMVHISASTPASAVGAGSTVIVTVSESDPHPGFETVYVKS